MTRHPAVDRSDDERQEVKANIRAVQSRGPTKVAENLALLKSARVAKAAHRIRES